MKRQRSWDAQKGGFRRKPLYSVQPMPVMLSGPTAVRPAKVRVVPGVTRTAGAYRRSMPKNNGEKKWLDTPFNIGSASSGGAILTNNLIIQQGTGESQRIGTKITLTDLMVRWAISNDNAGTGQMVSGNIRVVFLIDKQANGALPAWTDIFQDANLYTFRNLDNIDRFEILKDKIYPCPLVTANDATTSTSGKHLKWIKKCNLPIH